MAWIYLLAAGLCEIGFTTALRYVDGFKRPEPVAIFIICIACTLYFFEKSIREIPLGTAYAVWGGIGVGGTAILGILAFHEPVTFARLFFIATLIGSIVGLKLVSN